MLHCAISKLASVWWLSGYGLIVRHSVRERSLKLRFVGLAVLSARERGSALQSSSI